MYPREYSTYIGMENITDILEGKIRPAILKVLQQFA